MRPTLARAEALHLLEHEGSIADFKKADREMLVQEHAGRAVRDAAETQPAAAPHREGMVAERVALALALPSLSPHPSPA